MLLTIMQVFLELKSANKQIVPRKHQEKQVRQVLTGAFQIECVSSKPVYIQI